MATCVSPAFGNAVGDDCLAQWLVNLIIDLATVPRPS
jgi:hypothetical protein